MAVSGYMFGFHHLSNTFSYVFSGGAGAGAGVEAGARANTLLNLLHLQHRRTGRKTYYHTHFNRKKKRTHTAYTQPFVCSVRICGKTSTDKKLVYLNNSPFIVLQPVNRYHRKNLYELDFDILFQSIFKFMTYVLPWFCERGHDLESVEERIRAKQVVWFWCKKLLLNFGRCI